MSNLFATQPPSCMLGKMSGVGKYDHLSQEALIKLLERRDVQRRYGLVWEREGIERDRALNDDFVALDLDVGLSTPPGGDGGWRNLVIEGDNWDALRALRLAHAGRIRCILIDPPYNTGSRDFTYNDRFIGQQDRYRQSLWLEFLYKRLDVARDLLSDDGVLLVCINDENRARLDLLMEQLFPGMRIGSFVWRTKDTANNSRDRAFSSVHEHVLVYAGPLFKFNPEMTASSKYRRLPGDSRDSRLDPITMAQDLHNRPNTYYPIYNDKTDLWYPCSPLRVWSIWSERKPTRKKNAGPSLEDMIKAGRIYFPREDKAPYYYETLAELTAALAGGRGPMDGKGRPLLRIDLPDLEFWVGKRIAHGRPSMKTYLDAEASQDVPRPISSWVASVKDPISDDAVVSLEGERQGVGTDILMKIFGNKPFEFPKPPGFLRRLIAACTAGDELVLDFFSGSGTTAHSVLIQNSEDDANRRFIMVSNTEASVDAPEKNICRDVCAERIRRVIRGYGEVVGTGGDFAYLRTRRIPWDDVIYDLDAASIWTLLQLRYDRVVLPFNPRSPLQISQPDLRVPGSPLLAFVPQITTAAIEQIRALASTSIITTFTTAPGNLRDLLGMPNVAIEQIPDRLLAEFPRQIAGA